MARKRDFNPNILHQFISPALQPNLHAGIFFEKRIWQFIILLPRWFKTEQGQEPVCTVKDQDRLEQAFERHFGGCTSHLAPLRGFGQREKKIEVNIHTQILVLASRWQGTMRYFRALRKELEECSGEEQILILRQDLVVV